jgi:spermidine synthase
MARPRSIYIDGKSESNTWLDRETLVLSAHLPMLLAGRRERALVIGQGTGVTAAELARWPGLTRIDMVELSPTVARTLPLFREQIGDIGSDARLRLHVEDARHFLRRPGEGWDVIVSEPSHVWNSGNDLMFTLEFLRSVERRLRPGGVFLMWVHLYETDTSVICPIVSALATVFPETRAFRGTKGDWLIAASSSSFELTEDGLRSTLEAQPEVARGLAFAGIDGAAALVEREIGAFPSYAEHARNSCVPHVAGEARLAYRAAHALYEGRVLLEDELLGVGSATGNSVHTRPVDGSRSAGRESRSVAEPVFQHPVARPELRQRFAQLGQLLLGTVDLKVGEFGLARAQQFLEQRSDAFEMSQRASRVGVTLTAMNPAAADREPVIETGRFRTGQSHHPLEVAANVVHLAILHLEVGLDGHASVVSRHVLSSATSSPRRPMIIVRRPRPFT